MVKTPKKAYYRWVNALFSAKLPIVIQNSKFKIQNWLNRYTSFLIFTSTTSGDNIRAYVKMLESTA